MIKKEYLENNGSKMIVLTAEEEFFLCQLLRMKINVLEGLKGDEILRFVKISNSILDKMSKKMCDNEI